MNYLKRGFAHYFDFAGRASRKEYWLWVLWVSLISLGLLLIAGLFGDNGGGASREQTYFGALILPGIWGLITFIPNLAIIVRRLHDSGHGGGWFFILIVPIIGPIWFLVLMIKPSERRENRFGENPKVRELRKRQEKLGEEA